MSRALFRTLGLLPISICLLVLAGCGQARTPAERAASALPALIQKLKHSDPQLRGEAAHEIRALGPEHTKEAIPHLIANFEDENQRAREWAAGIVAQYGSDAVPGVLEAARSSNSRRRALACYSIGHLPGDVLAKHKDETLPLLVEGLKDENVEVRRNAAWAIGPHGSLAKSTLSTQLTTLENDKDKLVRFHLLKGLGMMGEDAKEALPILEKFKDDPDVELRALASRVKFFVEGNDKKPPE